MENDNSGQTINGNQDALLMPDQAGSYTEQLKKNKHHLRGVQTMFKNSSSNHQRLSVMADNKAFIMISVNSIIISVVIGLLIGKFVQNSNLIYPTMLLMAVCVLTVIYSVLATRPNVPGGTFTMDQIKNKTGEPVVFWQFLQNGFERL